MREKVKKVLLECGIPMNQSGFLYILDAMELFEENGAPITNLKALYRLISNKRKKKPEHIIENIGYSINFGYANGSRTNWIKYFGLYSVMRSNGNHLAYMWQKLKEEE